MLLDWQQRRMAISAQSLHLKRPASSTTNILCCPWTIYGMFADDLRVQVKKHPSMGHCLMFLCHSKEKPSVTSPLSARIESYLLLGSGPSSNGRPLVGLRSHILLQGIQLNLPLGVSDISKFNGTSTPKGSYRAKTGDNDQFKSPQSKHCTV